MVEDRVQIEARVRFLATEEGGRTTPLQGRGQYRPNHNFFGPDSRKMCMGFIELPDTREVQPGDTIDTSITLIVWPELKGEICEGRQWHIQEGGRIVAIGTVLRVNN